MISPEWSFMSDKEKDAALKSWNEDYNRKHPYVPPGGYSTWWDVLKPLLLMVGVIVGAILFGRQIATFFTAQAPLISAIAIYALWRNFRLEAEMSSLRKTVNAVKERPGLSRDYSRDGFHPKLTFEEKEDLLHAVRASLIEEDQWRKAERKRLRETMSTK